MKNNHREKRVQKRSKKKRKEKCESSGRLGSMTVMLLQRSSTPQLTQSQKTADSNNSNDELGTPAPCLILLDIQENSELERASYPSFNNNNNNSINNNRFTEKQDRKNVSDIGRSSTCGSGKELII